MSMMLAFVSIVMKNSPRSAPTIDPSPPFRLQPPITAPEMTRKLRPFTVCGTAAFNRAAYTIPDKAPAKAAQAR